MTFYREEFGFLGSWHFSKGNPNRPEQRGRSVIFEANTTLMNSGKAPVATLREIAGACRRAHEAAAEAGQGARPHLHLHQPGTTPMNLIMSLILHSCAKSNFRLFRHFCIKSCIKRGAIFRWTPEVLQPPAPTYADTRNPTVASVTYSGTQSHRGYSHSLLCQIQPVGPDRCRQPDRVLL